MATALADPITQDKDNRCRPCLVRMSLASLGRCIGRDSLSGLPQAIQLPTIESLKQASLQLRLAVLACDDRIT